MWSEGLDLLLDACYLYWELSTWHRITQDGCWHRVWTGPVSLWTKLKFTSCESNRKLKKKSHFIWKLLQLKVHFCTFSPHESVVCTCNSSVLRSISAVCESELPVSLLFKIKPPTESNSSSSLSCSSESDAPATADGRPRFDVQLSEVGWRAGLTSTGRAWPVHIVPSSQWSLPAESQPFHWPAGVPPRALPLSLLLPVSPLHRPHLSSSPSLHLILSSPHLHLLLLLFFVLRWRHRSLLCSAPPLFLLPFCGGGVQPPSSRRRRGEPEAALSLRQLRVSSSARRFTDALTSCYPNNQLVYEQNQNWFCVSGNSVLKSTTTPDSRGQRSDVRRHCDLTVLENNNKTLLRSSRRHIAASCSSSCFPPNVAVCCLWFC